MNLLADIMKVSSSLLPSDPDGLKQTQVFAGIYQFNNYQCQCFILMKPETSGTCQRTGFHITNLFKVWNSAAGRKCLIKKKMLGKKMMIHFTFFFPKENEMS